LDFPEFLAALVTDQFNNPIAGADVTFTAPTFGIGPDGFDATASGTFGGATSLGGNLTDVNGVALASLLLTANQRAGTFNVTASTPVGSEGPVISTSGFDLTNLAGPVASITPFAGTPQSTQVTLDFPEFLAALVTDQFNNPISGAEVTFSAPTSSTSPSGTFGEVFSLSGNFTDTFGIAQAGQLLTANQIPGEFNITASTLGGDGEVSSLISTDDFELTNLAVNLPDPNTVDQNDPSRQVEDEPKGKPKPVEEIPNIPNGKSGNNVSIAAIEGSISQSYVSHLGGTVLGDIEANVQNKLLKVTQTVATNPGVFYITRISANTNIADADVSTSSTLIASSQSSLPLQGNAIAQRSTSNSSQCIPGESLTPGDPLWQLDSCGWQNLFPETRPINETDKVLLVLVTPSGKVTRRVVEGVTYTQVVDTVRQFQLRVSDALSLPSSYLPLSQQLYHWLIRPMEPTLEAKEVDNLVFILDEGLRSMPFAALHDGTGYIIERYSVGLMPSMSLSDTTPTNIKGMKVLAMGASTFPNDIPLPAVPAELATIANQLWAGQAQAFLNEDFTSDNLKQLRSSDNFGIVHLATHGDFNPGDPRNSYIEFSNRKVTLDQVLDLGLTGDNPASLLVLSACRTALGDREAELGFTGLAAATGVQTAVGGLWYINDIATLGLMTNFYAQLKVAPIRAEALRQAQLAMLRGQVQIEDDQLNTAGVTVPLPEDLQGASGLNFSHPYYWSGMTMIGNPW
jgi:CHAT domain-containing protein